MKHSIVFALSTSIVLSLQSAKFLHEESPKVKDPAEQALKESLIKECDFKVTMRSLWNDHVVWTREYIVSETSNSPFTPFAAKRLLRNQQDIGNAIIPFYGESAAKKLTKLLEEHITLAVDLVKLAIKGAGLKGAAKKKNETAFKAVDKKWHKNADEISAFLSKANPYLPYKAVRDMMYDHLKLTTTEAVNRLTKNWDADVKTYDEVREQITHMADALSKALIRAFPDKFKAKKIETPKSKKENLK